MNSRISGYKKYLSHDSAVALYLVIFLLFNVFGVSVLSPSAWAPYFNTAPNTAAPAGSLWIEGSSLRWADGSTEYYTDHDLNARGNWHLDSGSGSTAVDSSGNNNDGSIVNSPTWISGKYGSALSFSGASGEGVDLGGVWDDHQNSMTVSLWVKPDSSGSSNDRIISQDCSEWFCFNYYGTDTVRFYIDNTATDVTMTEGQWHHVAIAFDVSARTADAYIDGTRVIDDNPLDSWNHADRPIVLAGNTEGYGDISGNEFNGDIDEVRFYNGALNQNLIRELAAGEDGKVSGPPGSVWIEGNNLHFIGANGYERVISGVDTGNNPSTSSGASWIETGRFHYVDASGNERTSYYPRSCKNVGGGSGTYTIDPDGAGTGVAPFDVTCDMSTGSGGWIQISLARSNSNWAVGNDYDRCSAAGDAAKHYDHISTSNFNFRHDNDDHSIYTYDVDYTTAGNTLTEAQEDAIAESISELYDGTRVVGVSCDDDDDSIEHNTWLYDNSGNRITIQDGYVGNSNNIGWWVWDTTSGNSFTESTASISGSSMSALPGSYIMPDQIGLQTDANGYAVFGYEKSYALVK